MKWHDEAECPYCKEPVVGYACATCGFVPFDPDSTGDTGEDDNEEA